jgi:hypothetical protein
MTETQKHPGAAGGPQKTTFVAANPTPNQVQNDQYADPIMSSFEANDPSYQAPIYPPQNYAISKPLPWAAIGAILGLVLVLSGAGVAIYSYMQQQNTASVVSNQVSIAFSGSQVISVGSTKEWSIEVKNNNTITMYNTQLVLQPDSGFKFKKNNTSFSCDPTCTTFFIDQIDPGASKVVKFEGSLTGNVGEQVSLQALVRYNEATVAGRSAAQHAISSEKFTSTIANPEVKIEASRLKDVVEKGGDAQVQLTVENISDQDILDLQVRAQYPLDSFSYFSSSLDTGSGNAQTTPSQADNVWNIPRLEKRAKQTIIIKGKVKSQAKSEIEFGFVVSAQASAQVYTPIANTSVRLSAIDQAIAVSTFFENKVNNPIIQPGDDLQVVIRYENKGSKTLNDVQIVSSISDPADIIDWPTIKFATGTGTITGKTVSWRGAGLPALVSVGANESGSIRYSVKVKTSGTVLNSNLAQEKYTLQPAAEVSATDRQPVSVVSEKVYQLGGLLGFTQTVEIIDDVASTSFVNDKYDLPKDFKVARVTWTFTTTQNRIKSITIDTGTPLLGNPQNSDILSPVIKPTNISDKLIYNGKTGALSLALDSIDPYLGFSKPAYTVQFELKVKPDSNTKSYKNLTILRSLSIRGLDDTITGKEYTQTIEAALSKN